MYGDGDDVFIDHHITRAPNFHSVAKLATVPDFWTGDQAGGTLGFRIASKRMYDVSPKLVRRVAYVDNSFHLFWLPSPGVYASPPPGPAHQAGRQPCRVRGGPRRRQDRPDKDRKVPPLRRTPSELQGPDPLGSVAVRGQLGVERQR